MNWRKACFSIVVGAGIVGGMTEMPNRNDDLPVEPVAVETAEAPTARAGGGTTLLINVHDEIRLKDTAERIVIS